MHLRMTTSHSNDPTEQVFPMIDAEEEARKRCWNGRSQRVEPLKAQTPISPVGVLMCGPDCANQEARRHSVEVSMSSRNSEMPMESHRTATMNSVEASGQRWIGPACETNLDHEQTSSTRLQKVMSPQQLQLCRGYLFSSAQGLSNPQWPPPR